VWSRFRFGARFTNRLNTAVPIYLQAGYSNGGGTENVGRAAASFVW
jgi:hypothetical protein